MGIPFPQVPLFPIKEGNQWKKGQGRLQDFNAGMKMVMAQMMHMPGSVATSHGLKATPLAWTCAFGLSEEERTALGYHVGKSMNATVWVYARDRLAAPLANMDKMLLAMRKGDFDPDEVLPFGG
eukprot:888944-Karenia_brevis.AAC.1